MNKEDIFDKEQLEILLKDLQDIDKFTGFKDGSFKYELGKYQANLLVNCIKKYKEVIDNIKKIIIDNSYNELYECFNELREERVIEIVNVLDIKKDMLKRWNK